MWVVPGILVDCVGILQKHGRFAIVFVLLPIGRPRILGKSDSAFELRSFMSVTRGGEALTLNLIRISVPDCESGIAFEVNDHFAKRASAGKPQRMYASQ